MNFTLEPLLVATGEVRNELTVIYCVYLQLSILMKLLLEKPCFIKLIQLLSSGETSEYNLFLFFG